MKFKNTMAIGATFALAAISLVGCSSDTTQSTDSTATTTPQSETSSQSETSAQSATTTTTPEWSYSGTTGPDTWGTVSPTCAASATGTQSPIDIVSANLLTSAAVSNPKINYVPMTFKVENNGHTIEAVPEDLTASSVVIGGVTYYLQQFHLHSPSEHQVDGVNAAMELHLVNKADDGSIAVISVLLEVGAENAALSELFTSMPTTVTEEANMVALTSMIDPSTLIPTGSTIAEYAGSLTTPPCTEGVAWNVFMTPQQISQEQLDAFTAIYPSNNRPVQEINGRLVILDPNVG